MTNLEKLHLLRMHRIGCKRPEDITPGYYKRCLRDALQLEAMINDIVLKPKYKYKRIKYDITIGGINIKGTTNSVHTLRKEILACDTLSKANKEQLSGKTTQ